MTGSASIRKRHPRDMDGEPVKAGDTVAFSYGIPPVYVEGVVFERNGRLILPTPGHKPEEESLWSIKRHYGFRLIKRKTY